MQVITRDGRKKAIHLTIAILFNHRIDFYFIILFFLRGGGEKLALCNSKSGRNV